MFIFQQTSQIGAKAQPELQIPAEFGDAIRAITRSGILHSKPSTSPKELAAWQANLRQIAGNNDDTYCFYLMQIINGINKKFPGSEEKVTGYNAFDAAFLYECMTKSYLLPDCVNNKQMLQGKDLLDFIADKFSDGKGSFNNSATEGGMAANQMLYNQDNIGKGLRKIFPYPSHHPNTRSGIGMSNTAADSKSITPSQTHAKFDFPNYFTYQFETIKPTFFSPDFPGADLAQKYFNNAAGQLGGAPDQNTGYFNIPRYVNSDQMLGYKRALFNANWTAWADETFKPAVGPDTTVKKQITGDLVTGTGATFEQFLAYMQEGQPMKAKALIKEGTPTWNAFGKDVSDVNNVSTTIYGTSLAALTSFLANTNTGATWHLTESKKVALQVGLNYSDYTITIKNSDEKASHYRPLTAQTRLLANIDLNSNNPSNPLSLCLMAGSGKSLSSKEWYIEGGTELRIPVSHFVSTSLNAGANALFSQSKPQSNISLGAGLNIEKPRWSANLNMSRIFQTTAAADGFTKAGVGFDYKFTYLRVGAEGGLYILDKPPAQDPFIIPKGQMAPYIGLKVSVNL
ncbi:MAG: hypothetical protein NTX79_01465 [Candidatus Micrarchaeota archaeon]|nr:hypothetical protein [Candidatus Micrarchaeota archaeon]